MAFKKLQRRKEKVVVVDSNYLCHSARHSQNLAGLSLDGIKTGIVFGFFRSIMTLYKKLETPYFIFIWDSGVSYRKQISADYKANRIKFDESMGQEELDEARTVYNQFNILRDEIIPKLGFPSFIESGFEGDDLIASVVTNPYPGYKYIIASPDHDLYQLLEYADLYSPKTRNFYTEANFRKEWGIDPCQWANVKAMAGCVSDNVKGLLRVGEKTAAKFLRGELYKGEAFKHIMSNSGKEIIEKNMRLVYLPFEGTPDLVINPADFSIDSHYFQDVCETYGLMSFLTPSNYGQWKALFRKEKPE